VHSTDNKNQKAKDSEFKSLQSHLINEARFSMIRFDSNYKGLNCLTFKDGTIIYIDDEEVENLRQQLNEKWL